MKKEKTQRGFSLYKFTDRNGEKCSIQKSSIATEDAIWLGTEKLRVQEFVAGRTPAWQDVEFKHSTGHHFIGNNSMHLTRKQVKKLLPILQKFVDTGEI